jgi:hypothetical protein
MEPKPEEKHVKKRKKVGLVVSVIIGILVGATVTIVVLWKPNPEITKLEGYGLEALNVFYVDVTVKNNGREGYIVVYAEINSTSKYEKQEQTIYLVASESKNLTFTFNIIPWGEITYRAWAVPH